GVEQLRIYGKAKPAGIEGGLAVLSTLLWFCHHARVSGAGRQVRAGLVYLSTSMRTLIRPSRVLPMLEKAERDRSVMRPRTKGPRSLMRTTTLLPFFTLVTLTLVPKGRVRCAAVFRLALYSWPLAVLRFWNLSA